MTELASVSSDFLSNGTKETTLKQFVRLPAGPWGSNEANTIKLAEGFMMSCFNLELQKQQ